jgi:hypothetical protein
VLVDTEADPVLFKAEAARRGVDLLCENALAAAEFFAGSGREVLTGFSGGKIYREKPASVFAFPAALPLFSDGADLPLAPGGCGCLILALPRSAAGGADGSGLDRFMKRREPGVEIDVIFLYGSERLDEYGRASAALYGRRPGVRAANFFCGGPA